MARGFFGPSDGALWLLDPPYRVEPSQAFGEMPFPFHFGGLWSGSLYHSPSPRRAASAVPSGCLVSSTGPGRKARGLMDLVFSSLKGMGDT